MTAKKGYRELDAQANEALTRFYTGSGYEPVDSRLPFHAMLEREEDGTEEPVGEYEIRQRHIGVKAFFRFLTDRGVHPAAMLKQLAAVGRGIHAAPFHELTMHEVAMLFDETPAAHSYRCKLLSNQIKLSGQKGAKLPGQKSADATESYKVCRKGNNNRLGGKKAEGRGGDKGTRRGGEAPRARQSSFLRTLHVPHNAGKTQPNNDHERI